MFVGFPPLSPPSPPLLSSPPLPSNYRNMQPPPRYEQELAAAAGNMSSPIVIALLLSVFLFTLCLIFFFSPSCMHKERQPIPIDVEDAYFIDENAKRRYPSFARTPACNSIATENPQKKLNHPKNTYFSFTPPPPAYTSRPGSPTGLFDEWSFNSLLGGANRKSSDRTKESSRFRFFAWSPPAFLAVTRRARSTPIPISKPILQPEAPLPGPNILTDSDIPQQVSTATFIRPCIGKSVSEHILHPSASDLHTPSQAHVYDRDTISMGQQNSQYLTATHSHRSSTRIVGTQSHGSISSITSSMVGIAL